MKHCMLMSVLSLLFSLLLPVTVQHAAGLSGGEALPEADAGEYRGRFFRF